MKRFIQGKHRTQNTLFPETLDDYVTECNPVRVVEVFVEGLDLGILGFEGIKPEATGSPCLSSINPSEDLYLGLPEPHSINPTP
jgi:hypothetical protein